MLLSKGLKVSPSNVQPKFSDVGHAEQIISLPKAAVETLQLVYLHAFLTLI